MLYLLWGNGGPPTSAFRGLTSVLKSLVRQINSSGVIVMFKLWPSGLKLPIHTPFGEFLGIFSPHDVTHRPDPQKDRPWAETRHLSHSAVQRFDLCA